MSEFYFFIYVKIYFLFNPHYLRAYIGLPWNPWAPLRCENGFWGKIQKTLDTKRASILKHNCKYIKKQIIPVQNQKVNCVLSYIIFKIIEK